MENIQRSERKEKLLCREGMIELQGLMIDFNWKKRCKLIGLE